MRARRVIASFSRGAALIGLGYQPQVQKRTVLSLSAGYLTHQNSIIVPGFSMKRGHPWLLHIKFWKDVLDMSPPLTLRVFLTAQSAQILYVAIDNPSILKDLDRPQDYENFRPK